MESFFYIILILINFSFISSDEGKCTTLEHCLKCPQSDKCEECEPGFELNNNHTKCDSKEKSSSSSSSPKKSSQNQNNPVNSSPKKSSQNQKNPVNSSPKKSSQNQNNPINSSPKKSSQNQNNPVNSSPKQSIQNNINNNNNNPNLSNSVQPSSKSLLSAFNITKRLGTDSTKIGFMIIIFVVLVMGIILCSRFLCWAIASDTILPDLKNPKNFIGCA